VSRDANERISGILDNLRSFIRLDGGERARMNVHEGLDSTLALLESETRGRIEVVKEYGDVPDITCYPGEVNQVFMSLLSNAVEAIRAEGQIVVRTTADADVRIEIQDNGTGIEPDQIDRLFEPGFRRNGSRVKAGMGLMVCFNIVQKHGGRIDVDSTPGTGSTFTVVLPRN
jgi:two-component system NtrC family sensor kinase